VSLVLVVVSALSVMTQEKSDELLPKRGDTVVVRGCISGGKIESTETSVRDGSGRYSGLVTYRLTGDKKVLNALKKEHGGHVEVLTGILKSELPAGDAPRGKRIGNTGISIGIGRPPRANPAAPTAVPVLDVKEFEHSGVTCRP
jgi:hypothetical protein